MYASKPRPKRRSRLAGREFDIVIDDASHVNTHQIAAFGHFWPLVRPGGWYVIEDVHASYWGRAYNHGQHKPIIAWIKDHIDAMQCWG